MDCNVPKGIELDGIVIHGKRRKALVRFKGGALWEKTLKPTSPYPLVQEGEAIGNYML
jgi:hypothetical protein